MARIIQRAGSQDVATLIGDSETRAAAGVVDIVLPRAEIEQLDGLTVQAGAVGESRHFLLQPRPEIETKHAQALLPGPDQRPPRRTRVLEEVAQQLRNIAMNLVAPRGAVVLAANALAALQHEDGGGGVRHGGRRWRGRTNSVNPPAGCALLRRG